MHVHGGASFFMHGVQAVASDTGEGVPPGEPPPQAVGATVGAARRPFSDVSSANFGHEERPPEASTGNGDSMLESLEPGASSGDGSSNSFFLSLAPGVFCRRCGGAFRPLRGAECNSLCLNYTSLSFLRSPSPKRRRVAHRKAGPPS